MPKVFTPPTRPRNTRGWAPSDEVIAEVLEIIESGQWAELDETSKSRKEIMAYARGYTRALEGKASEQVRFTYLSLDEAGAYVALDRGEDERKGVTFTLGVALRSTSYRPGTTAEDNGDNVTDPVDPDAE